MTALSSLGHWGQDHLFTLLVPTREERPIVIRAYDGGRGLHGGYRIDVTVTYAGETIFKRGDTYCGTPAIGGVSIDGDEARELVCSLVAMKPGDTDAEYFASYSPEQIEFVQSFSEEITQYAERYRCAECGAVNGRSRNRWEGKRCKHHKRGE